MARVPGPLALLLVAAAALLACPPAAADEGIVTFETCSVLDGSTWVDCRARMPVGGSSGVPAYTLWYGVEASPECGAGDLTSVTSVDQPQPGQCWLWVGAGAAEATVPTPDPEAALDGRL